jgi:SAM-dependent methyltransferase
VKKLTVLRPTYMIGCMISSELLELARCPVCLMDIQQGKRPNSPDTGRLQPHMDGFKCATCGTPYVSFSNPPHQTNEKSPPPVDDSTLLPRRGYLDLFPPQAFSDQTKYLEEEFEHEIDHQHISLPLLGAKVRNDLLKQMLAPKLLETALEVGCGNGKFCYWNRKLFKTVVGVDAAPLFADEALNEVPLVRGDVRLLPFGEGAFDKIFSIDVLEHLPAEGIAPFFAELNRVLKPGGTAFIFSNTREMGRLAPIIRLEKKIARYFSDKGIFDFKRDELRKSDHIKALKTYEDLQLAIIQGGFRLEKVVFWNGVFQGLVDNIIVKAGEYAIRRAVRNRVNRQTGQNHAENSTVASRLSAATTGISAEWADGSNLRNVESRENVSAVQLEAEKTAAEAQQNAAIDLVVRKTLKRRLAYRPNSPIMLFLRLLTGLMKLDIILFGKLRTGVFFITIRKK